MKGVELFNLELKRVKQLIERLNVKKEREMVYDRDAESTKESYELFLSSFEDAKESIQQDIDKLHAE